MANPLTGDFDAILQVSGKTINRLLASMHQNAFADPEVPSFPHTFGIRIGDSDTLDGVRGTVWTQIGVPSVELIHSATDRFILEVGVRAWYRPDSGTEPLPSFIHGTVRAEYRVHDIDRSCPGWAADASKFLWVRVVRDSVTFKGTAEDDSTGTQVFGDGQTAAATIGMITRQIAWQLATRFDARPHELKEGFKRGSLRTLNVPLAGSALAIPLALNGEPQGDIASVDTVLVEDKHFAVAVSVQYIKSLVTSNLPLQFPPVGEYRVEVGATTVTWQPQSTSAVIKVHVSATATTESMLPNVTVSIDQDINLNFDGSGGLGVSPGSLTVSIDWGQTGRALADVGRQVSIFDSSLDPYALHGKIKTHVQTAVQKACDDAQAILNGMAARIQTLTDQLQTFDKQASILIDEGSFLPDGIMLRGEIFLSQRQGPVVEFTKTAMDDGYNALESWIPGGRIDKLEWSWSWPGSGKPDSAVFHDRFLLRRAPGELSRWGLSRGITRPIPGLDGYGEVCLQVSGMRVDPVTGDLKSVVSRARCTRFGGFVTTLASERSRLYLRDMPQLSKDVPFPQLRDRPLLAFARGRVGETTVNTLLIHVNEAWHGEIAETLVTGLETCGRYDAGLTVLVLFRERLLEASGATIVEAIETLAGRLGVAVHVNEDVDGGWSRALRLRGAGGIAWAIIAPDGRLAWSHEGRLAPEALASALDTRLHRSRNFTPVPYRSVEIGARINPQALNPVWREPRESPCPPIRLPRLGEDTAITFVHKQSPASATHLQRLADRAARIFVVVDGADERETESLKRSLGVDVVAIPDPTGTISDRFEISVWPTTITVDRGGIVSHVEFGLIGAPADGKRPQARRHETDSRLA